MYCTAAVACKALRAIGRDHPLHAIGRGAIALKQMRIITIGRIRPIRRMNSIAEFRMRSSLLEKKTKGSRRGRLRCGLVLALLLWAAGGALAADPARDCYPIRIEGAVVCAELAVTDAEVQKGLMGRTAMAPDAGMLFIYARPKRLSFWMKNTVLSLDIGYFDAFGVLQEIHPMAPLDLRPVVSVSDRIRFALELARGGFARMGLAVGARMDLAGVDAAIAARGFDVSVQPAIPGPSPAAAPPADGGTQP